jgi:hypothetical protein
MIERNRHPSGRVSNMIFGLCAITDGFVRVLSLGFLHSRFTLEWSKYQALRRIKLR